MASTHLSSTVDVMHQKVHLIKITRRGKKRILKRVFFLSFFWSGCHAVHNVVFLFSSSFVDIVHYYLYCSQTLPNPFQQVLWLIALFMFFNSSPKAITCRDVNHKESIDAILILILLNNTDFLTNLLVLWWVSQSVSQWHAFVIFCISVSHHIHFRVQRYKS